MTDAVTVHNKGPSNDRQNLSNDQFNDGKLRMDRYNKLMGLGGGAPGGAAPPAPRGGGGGQRVAPPVAPPAVRNKSKTKDAKPPGEDTSPDGALSQKLRQKAEDMMDGKESRYNDERVSMMKDQMFESTIGRVGKEVRAMDGGMVRRGMFRSGMSARAESDIRQNAMTNYSRGVKDIMIKKMDAEFEDKMKGMQMTQTWLSQKQNYDLGKERNAIARQQIAASTAASMLSAQVSREGIAANASAARAALQDRVSARAEGRAWEASGNLP